MNIAGLDWGVWQFRWLLFVLSGLVFTLLSPIHFSLALAPAPARSGPLPSLGSQWMRLRGLGRGQLCTNHWYFTPGGNTMHCTSTASLSQWTGELEWNTALHCTAALCTVIMTIRTMACVMILILPSLIISPVPYKMIYKKKIDLMGTMETSTYLQPFYKFPFPFLAPNRSLIASLLFVLLRFRPEFLSLFYFTLDTLVYNATFMWTLNLNSMHQNLFNRF